MSPHLLFKRLLFRFRRDDSGAVTVDWVVLTGLVVGLSAVVFNTLTDPINNGGEVIANMIEQAN